MKDFLKFTLATVTGIILSSIVLFIIGMVTLFGIVSTADTETIVKKNSVMMLDLNGVLVERTQGESVRYLITVVQRRLQYIRAGRYSFFHQKSKRK